MIWRAIQSEGSSIPPVKSRKKMWKGEICGNEVGGRVRKK